MPARGAKQTDRNANKKTKKVEDDEPAAATDSSAIVERGKTLILGSCVVQFAPKLKDLLQAADGAESAKANGAEKVAEKEEKEEKEEEKEETKEEAEKENGKEVHADVPEDAGGIFQSLCQRLEWYNILGLGEPASGEEAKKAWLEVKDLELDWGPRAKRGNPGLDRILVNVTNMLPQYLHALLALMMLRSFLFRSWFACLPWLVLYQVLSVLVPLQSLAQLPQVPLEKVPVKFRVAATLSLNALVWFFFLYEAVWKMWFFEKIPVFGLLAYHAYIFRPYGK